MADLGLEGPPGGNQAQRRQQRPKVTELELKLRSLNSTPSPSPLRSCFKYEHLLPFHASKTVFPSLPTKRWGAGLQVGNAIPLPQIVPPASSSRRPPATLWMLSNRPGAFWNRVKLKARWCLSRDTSECFCPGCAAMRPAQSPQNNLHFERRSGSL